MDHLNNNGYFDINAYEYYLPQELIAQNPADPRDSSRLMVVDRENGRITHSIFSNLHSFLKSGDLLMLNDTKVFRARLRGVKKGGQAEVEILLLRPLDCLEKEWEALVRPGKRLSPGASVILKDKTEIVIGESTGAGTRRVGFPGGCYVRALMERIGEVPLPPYIKNTSAPSERYQTVYADKSGSAAAPTAGLHFTERVFRRLDENGVEKAFLTLHVGLGTFRPVKENDIRNHKMHEEYCSIDKETSEKINRTRRRGNRVIAVGTTVVRTLESLADKRTGEVNPGSLWTKAYIYPGYAFKVVDAMVTNFHLPKSTLLMLVAAFAGRDLILEAYEEAVRMRYRFFSFGDAMLII